MTKLSLSLAGLALLGAAACAQDPTAGKAKAAVSEAKTETRAPAAAETLAVTPATSKIQFVGAKVTAQHVGEFQDFQGTIHLVDGKPEASHVQFEVKVASFTVDSGGDALVGHLKSPDFFDVQRFPTATFSSTEIKVGSPVAGYTHTVIGNLEIRGTKKSITFPAAITVSPQGVQVKSEFGIARKDFGIVYPGMKDDLIKDNVLLRIDLAASRTAQAKS